MEHGRPLVCAVVRTCGASLCLKSKQVLPQHKATFLEAQLATWHAACLPYTWFGAWCALGLAACAQQLRKASNCTWGNPRSASKCRKALASALCISPAHMVCMQVGHVVGLGDRHGENLLLDASTGDLVHIDFSCLFDRVRCPGCRCLLVKHAGLLLQWHKSNESASGLCNLDLQAGLRCMHLEMHWLRRA